ncbi:MAG: histidine kinase [Burkholderiaceae bacterium]|nr:histidine kinase [Burkholderiaceae bacterium]
MLPCLCGGVMIAFILVASAMSAWANALFLLLPMSLILSFIAPSAYYVCRSLPFARRRFFSVAILYASTTLLSGLFWAGLCWLWNMFSLWLEQPWAGIQFHQNIALILLAAGCGFYLISLLIADIFFAFTQMSDAERRQSDLQILARDAELQMLRTQINPHFLFNSLNSISALTTIDAAGARNMTIELAQFFRQTLALSERRLITLEEEVQLCQHFLSIEKIRFGKKLQTEIEIPVTVKNALIPPMSLQPLIENAIKHGIHHLSEGGTIQVAASRNGDWLHLQISNPVQAASEVLQALPYYVQETEQRRGNGTGLKNLRARFHALYQDQSRIEWQHTSDRFIVQLALPYRTEEASHE